MNEDDRRLFAWRAAVIVAAAENPNEAPGLDLALDLISVWVAPAHREVRLRSLVNDCEPNERAGVERAHALWVQSEPNG